MKKTSVRTNTGAVVSHVLLMTDVNSDFFKKNVFTAFIRSDHENGEKSVQHAPPNLVPPSVPPKPGALSGETRMHRLALHSLQKSQSHIK